MSVTRTRRVREKVGAAEARRIALAATGFGEKPRADADDPAAGRDLRRVINRVGIFQIDSVNVLVRAHYMPFFSRAGAYDRTLLDDAFNYAPRKLFEYWAHEASLLPVETQPLHRWHMDRAAHVAWGGMRRIATEKPELVEAVYEEVAEKGPIAARAMETAKRPDRKGPWWDWSDGKRALEFLFWSGRVTSARRNASFERLYDLPERVLPRKVLDAPTPAPEDAQRELVRISARATGVASEKDLRDYFRLDVADAKRAIAELVEAGELLEVDVEGWGRTQGYLWHETRVPRQIEATALLAPFDPLIWERSRAERIFGFKYRIEIYVPAPKRVHGYYVLPFLHGDRLVSRVDLKADRKAGTLRVLATHHEPDAPPDTDDALRGELRRLATWLDLQHIR